uniref:Uncharacterized protein n=1 Tax=Rhizophora mucronata TaxID=61149 RepID=A0A2P2MEP1_RHIMU
MKKKCVFCPLDQESLKYRIFLLCIRKKILIYSFWHSQTVKAGATVMSFILKESGVTQVLC